MAEEDKTEGVQGSLVKGEPEPEAGTVGTVQVERFYTRPDGSGEQSDESGYMDVRRFAPETRPGSISATVSMGLRMAEFENAKISVTVTVPCYQEEIDDAYEFVRRFSGMKVNESIKRLKAIRDGNNGGS